MKTIKTIKVIELLSTNITFRNSIHFIRTNIDLNVDFNILDFEGVEFISRSACDELVKLTQDKNKNITLKNMSSNLMQMFEMVEKNKKAEIKTDVDFVLLDNSSKIQAFFANF